MLYALTLKVIGITNKIGIISDDIVLNRYVTHLLQQEKIYKYKTYRELEHGFGSFLKSRPTRVVTLVEGVRF